MVECCSPSRCRLRHPTTPPSVPGRAAGRPDRRPRCRCRARRRRAGRGSGALGDLAGDRGREASSSTASPGRLKQFAVDAFGTNDKPALVTGIVITSILLGAVLGLAARQRWIVAPLGFVAFGLVGVWAMITDPQDSTGDAIFACLVSVLAGIGTFALLWRLATPHVVAPAAVWEPETPTSTAKVRQTVVDRRGFLAGVAGVVVLTGSATALSRRIRSGDSVNSARRATVLPRADSLGAPAGLAAVRGRRPHALRRAERRLLPHRHGAAGAPDRRRPAGRSRSRAWSTTRSASPTTSCWRWTASRRRSPCRACPTRSAATSSATPCGRACRSPTLLERAGVQSGADAGGRPLGRRLHRRLPDRRRPPTGAPRSSPYAMNGEPLPAEHGYPGPPRRGRALRLRVGHEVARPRSS